MHPIPPNSSVRGLVRKAATLIFSREQVGKVGKRGASAPKRTPLQRSALPPAMSSNLKPMRFAGAGARLGAEALHLALLPDLF